MKKRTARITVFLTVLGFAVGAVAGCGSSVSPGFEPVSETVTPTPMKNTSSVTVLDSGWSLGLEGESDKIWSETFLRTLPDGRVLTCFTFFQTGWTTATQIWCLPPETPVAR